MKFRTPCFVRVKDMEREFLEVTWGNSLKKVRIELINDVIC